MNLWSRSINLTDCMTGRYLVIPFHRSLNLYILFLLYCSYPPYSAFFFPFLSPSPTITHKLQNSKKAAETEMAEV